MPAPALLIFDLDGTLVETAPDLIATLNVILEEEGAPPMTVDSARAMIGMGAKALLIRGLAANGITPTPERLEEMNRRFLDHYLAHIADHSRTLPGLEAALDALAAGGHRFAVLTNKLEYLAVELLKRLGLSARFDAVGGGDTFGVAKPDPRTHAGLMAKLGAAGQPSIMVGDSKTDLDTARAAKIPCVLVDFGYTDVPARELGADLVISAWSELPAAIVALEAANRG